MSKVKRQLVSDTEAPILLDGARKSIITPNSLLLYPKVQLFLYASILELWGFLNINIEVINILFLLFTFYIFSILGYI
jgi:hypothetical protein